MKISGLIRAGPVREALLSPMQSVLADGDALVDRSGRHAYRNPSFHARDASLNNPFDFGRSHLSRVLRSFSIHRPGQEVR